MTLLTKPAFVTCVFYFALNFCLEGAMLGLAQWKDVIAGHFSSRISAFVFFGVIWLISFTLAWRLVMAPVFSKIPR